VIRVFIVGPSLLRRPGAQNLLTARGVEVVGSSESFDSLVSQWLEVEADVILVEASSESVRAVIDLISSTGLASDVAVVVVSDHSEIGLIAEALQKGVRAVLPNDLQPEQLVVALEAAASGLIVIHPAEVSAVFQPARQASPQLAELAEALTPRESEVLQMLASGLANKEIAARLAISEHTVKFHVASILGKLGAGSRTEAVSIGIRRGIVLL
jgi:NarL family two-component system response regulator YdfI